MLGEFRIEQERDLGRGLPHALRDLLLQFGIERNGAQRAAVGLKRFDELRAERPTRVFGKLVGILGRGGRPLRLR
jgi:hypothetical protein